MGNNSSRGRLQSEGPIPLRAFENSVRLTQTGNFFTSPNIKDVCCWPDDARNCDQYRATINYNNATFPSDILPLKSLGMSTIIQLGLITSVNSSLKFNFTNCGADCGHTTNLENVFYYLNGGSSGGSVQKYRGDPYNPENQSATWTNNTNVIQSFYMNLNGETTCVQYGLKNVSYTFTTTITIDMKKYCRTAQNFGLPACINFCSYEESATDCYNIALDKCFTNDTILDKDSHCYQFLNNYASRDNTSIVALDNKLKTYCSEKSITAENYKEQTTFPALTELCSCHLDDQIYNTYYDSMIQQIPNLNISGQGSKKCLFPYCNVSPFKSGDMKGTSTCPAIQCIQGISIENNGTINGNINSQTNANCINDIKNSSLNTGSSPGPSPSPGFTPAPSPGPGPSSGPASQAPLSTFWIIMIVLGVVFVLFIIFILFVGIRKKSKSQNNLIYDYYRY